MTARPIFELAAEPRSAHGKGANRRLRHQQQVPAVLYGGGEPPVSLQLDHKKIMHALEHEAFYSHLLTLQIGSNSQQAVLKALHRHPFKKSILHMDFLRVRDLDRIQMRIPLHFEGELHCPGVKAGGRLSHHLNEVEVLCTANHIPEFILVDLTRLELEDTLHLSDLILPTEVELVAWSAEHSPEHNQPVVSIHIPRGAEEPATPTTPTKETKVLPKGKEADGKSDGKNKTK